MKHTLFVLFFLMTSLAVSAANPVAIRCDKAPKLDGRLDDAVWKQAKVFDKFFVINTGKKPDHLTEVRILYDDKAFYFGFRSFWAPGKPVIPPSYPRDAGTGLGRHECVEIMLDIGATGSEYFHFFITAGNTMLDRYCNQGGYVANIRWNSTARSKVSTSHPDYWECEVMIPYSTLEIRNDKNGKFPININIARGARSVFEDSSIGSNGLFHNAGAFRKLEGFDMDLSPYAWSFTPPVIKTSSAGKTICADVSSNIVNNTGKKQQTRVSCILKNNNDAGMASVKKDFAPGKTETFTAAGIKLGEAGNYTCYITVHDQKNTVLHRSSFPVKIGFSPLEITLCDPHYRDAIFATQNLKEISADIRINLPGRAAKVALLDDKGKIYGEKLLKVSGNVKFDAAKLPDGNYKLTASIADDPAAGTVEKAFRKLPYLKNEVWRGKDGNWYVDGQKFFITTEWNARNHHIEGIKTSKTSFDNGLPAGVRRLTREFSEHPFTTMMKSGKAELSAEDLALIRSTAKKLSVDPDTFAHFLVDEPDNGRFPQKMLLTLAATIREADPYHPIFVSNNTVDGMMDYIDAAEVNGLHPYPHIDRDKQKANMGQVVSYLDRAVDFYRNIGKEQTIAYMQQGFNYTDYGAIYTRTPSYDEIRTEFLLAHIICARGIFAYTAPDGRYYPELKIGMVELMKEFNHYGNIFMEPEAKTAAMSAKGGPVRWIVRKYKGDYWIFAVSTDDKKHQITFDIPEIGGKKVQVFAEERFITAVNGKFTDTFDNFQVHVYTTSSELHPEISVAKAEKLIAEANAARKVPGSLLWQKFEDVTVSITTNSNAKVFRRPIDTLWHLADGIKFDKNYGGQRFAWLSNAKELPVWVQMDFKKPQTFSKAVIWCLDKSLKDYTISVNVNGKWVEIAKVTGGKEYKREFNFPTVTATGLRLDVTATNGDRAGVSEIEIFK